MVNASVFSPAPAGVVGNADRQIEAASENQAYRTVARSFSGELQRQEQRKKAVTTIVLAVMSSFFVGLIVVSFLSR